MMLRAVVVVLMMSFTLASCGKKGDLLPPPGYEENGG